MTRTANWLQDMEFDEVSLVDRPANQHAHVVITKRAPEEGSVDEFYNESGEVITDIDALEVGTIVYDADQRPFEITAEDDADAEVEERELVGAGIGKSLAEQVREDLSKALGDVERDEVISKALGQVAELSKRAEQAEELAKAERDLRLEREYIAKAATYGVPGVTPEELGRVMKNAAENLSDADCQVLAKAFASSGDVFKEIGATGTADSRDAFGVIEELLGGQESEIGKALSAKGADTHEVIEKAFEADPAAYDRYLAERQG